MENITADDARELAGVLDREIERFIANADVLIEERAKSGKRSVIVRDTYIANAGYNSKTDGPWKIVADIYSKRGFAVSFFYEERQFVDMGMKIEW